MSTAEHESAGDNRFPKNSLTKLFVSQIPNEMQEQELLNIFNVFGSISDIQLVTCNRNQTQTGCAFITFFSPKSASFAIEQFHDKKRFPNTNGPVQLSVVDMSDDGENKLFIGMLPKSFNEENVMSVFVQYGDLKEVHIIRGPDGTSRGCAFIKFVERESAFVAIEDMNESIPMGATRPLVVKFADSKRPGSSPVRNEETGSSYGPQSPVLKQYIQPPRPMYSPMVYQPMSPIMPSSIMQSAGMHSQYPYESFAQYAPAQHAMINHSEYTVQHGTMPTGMDNHGHTHTSLGRHNAAILRKDGSRSYNNYDNSRFEGIDHHNDASDEFSHYRSSNNNISRPPEGPSGANLFIYHLPRDLTDADLATLFAPFGNVISAKVFVDKRTSDSKGFGFVSYDTPRSAESAIVSMNGFPIGTKRLKVQHKRVSYDESSSSNMMMGGGVSHLHTVEFDSEINHNILTPRNR